MTAASVGDAIGRSATLSPCGRYRYRLERRWADGPAAMFLMLNPSTADGEVDDPTIRRCVGFARAWGYGGLMVGNLFGLRATDPRELRRSEIDPVGVDNDAHLLAMAGEAAVVVAAWGNHGSLLGRDRAVRGLVPGLRVLRMSRQGQPCHPLYMPAALVPIEWPAWSYGDPPGR